MRKAGKIIKVVFLTVFLTVYVVVALVNYSTVQSAVGAVAGNYLSGRWGGKVRVAAIGVNPFDNVILRGVELIDPRGDTICTAHTVKLKFSKFPIDEHGIWIGRAMIRDCRYHLAISEEGINLKYIIDYFAKGERKKDKKRGEFKVMVDKLVLDGVTYIQDLKDVRPLEEWNSGPGVDVKHMRWQNLNGVFRNVRVDRDNVTCRIDRMTVTEKSGLDVRELKMNVYVTSGGISATNMVVETADSRIEGDVLLDYHSWKSMKSFVDSVTMTCQLKRGSYGGMKDAAYWAHSLWGMVQRVDIEGRFGGSVSDLFAEDAHLSFGRESKLVLDGYMKGLPKIDSTMIDATVHKIYTTYDDLASVKHPRGIKMNAEKWIEMAEYVDGEVRFTGTIRDFQASMMLQTGVGDVKGDLAMAMNKGGICKYKGEVSSEMMRIGRIVPNEWVARSGFDLRFEGEGFDLPTMRASADGDLKHTVLKGEKLTGETKLKAEVADGKMVTDVNLEDDLADVSIHGEAEWDERGPLYSANIDAKHVDLKRLELWKDTSDKEAKFYIRARGRYRNIDDGNMYARLSVDETGIETDVRRLSLHDVVLSAREQNHWKNVSLRSNVVNGQMTGYYQFDGIMPILVGMAEDFLPMKGEEQGSANGELGRGDVFGDSRFELNVTLTDTVGLIKFFSPQLLVANGTSIQANYSEAGGLKPIVRSDSVGWNNICVYNVGINGSKSADIYRVRMTSDAIKIGKMMLAESSDAVIESSKNGANCHVVWDNGYSGLEGGNINVRMVGEEGTVKVIVDPSHLTFGNREWTLDGKDGDIWIGDEGWHVGNLAMVSGERSLLLKASRVGQNNDSIDIELNDFGLDVINPWIAASGMDLDGMVDGYVRIGFIDDKLKDKSTPYMNADLLASGLELSGERLGDTRIRSTWNADMGHLNLYLNSDKINTSGYVGLGEKNPELNFDVHIEDCGLALLQPLAESFARDIDGRLWGDVKIGGRTTDPRMDGSIYVDNGGITIDYLNVRYTFSDTLFLADREVNLHGFEIDDQEGNSAMVDGKIELRAANEERGIEEFSERIGLDLKVGSDRFMCLNTSAKHSDRGYYGTVIAAMNGTVKGTVKDIDVRLNARTMDGTVINLPISDKREVQQADYIHFTSYGEEDLESVEIGIGSEDRGIENGDRRTETGGDENRFLLTMDVETTPDMKIRIPMNFSSVVLNVSANGSGDLEMKTGRGIPFTIMGDYEMQGGTVVLDLLGVLSKNFTIDEGSSITLPGAVSDAIFDIKAVYSQRVNMSSLTGATSATESQKPITVENVIALSGTLQSPDIQFDIRLPNADQSVQEEVFAYIDRTNERDMLNQTVSLLLRKKFYSVSSTNNDANTSTASGEATELVLGTLGNVLSDMVQVVDVNFDYQAGNALTTDQYAVDISKEWNKFYFESTLGFGGEGREMSDVGGNNNMTGDMTVGYKINPRLHLFVFNRSNTNDYTRSDLPYKQGVGLKYTRDFDRIRDLFKTKSAR